MVLSSLKELKHDMESKNWIICSFTFSYKSEDYIVLIKRFVKNENKKDRYALVKIEFLKNNLDDSLEIEANSNKLLVDVKVLRNFFGIEYSDNIGDIIKQFTKQFASCIPIKVNEKYSEIEKKAMIYGLSKSDSEDPRKIYCTKVRRNPLGQKRSPYNSDKTRLLRPKLFYYYREDESISFCYSAEKHKEKDDNIIMKNFTEE